MAERSKGKRPRLGDGDDGDAGTDSMEKKVRFPKGKKARRGDADGGLRQGSGGGGDDADEGFALMLDPRLAIKERAKRRDQMREDELFRDQQAADVSAAEVDYEENANLDDDGIQIEPFNLKQEREEGYFDANGNYIEYVNKNEIKDAWLDSAVVDPKYAEKMQKAKTIEEDYQELSSEGIGKIKRSIANVLQPGETIIQALKRLKGSGDKKEKMSEGTKRIFDQLTEDAMKLLENGEYNVYHEEKEIFEREAEGYERIANARKGIFVTADESSLVKNRGEDLFSDSTGEAGSSSIWDRPLSVSGATTSLQAPSGDGGEEFDMFGDDEDNTNANPLPDGTGLASGSSSEQFQPSAQILDQVQDSNSSEAATGAESDYVYDQATGYYYSSSLGYYYDPTTSLYCSATTGKWYSFDEQTGEYIECQSSDAAATET